MQHEPESQAHPQPPDLRLLLQLALLHEVEAAALPPLSPPHVQLRVLKAAEQKATA